MKSFIGGCLVGGLFLMAYYGGNQPILRAADPPTVGPASTLQYIVEVDVPGSTGSGFIAYAGGGVTEIITCSHVVHDGDPKKPLPPYADIIYQGATFHGKIVKDDTTNDLAMILVAGVIGSSAPIDLDAVTPGERELVVGSPYGRGIEITEGYTSRYVYPPGIQQLMIQGSAATWPGNSGGPVFVFEPTRHEWEVAGIIDGVWFQDKQAIPTINYAIPSAALLLFMGAALPNTAGAHSDASAG